LDKESGFYILMARYYHPIHGVFLSVDPDPVDDDDPITQNEYTYANNNPVMNVDPDGHWAVDAAFLLYDIYSFGKRPSWGNAGMVALSAACFIDPTGIASGAAHAAKVATTGYRVSKTTRIAKKMTFGSTALKRMQDPSRYVPRHTIAQAIVYGKKSSDGAKGYNRIR
jgi:RHS repeat-associated protein